MKILAVLAILISLCCAQLDFTTTSTANATQASSGSYTRDSTGSCDITLTYTAATTTLSGEITCTGLKGNLTAVHFHDVSSSYTVTYNTGSVLDDISKIVIPADPTAFPIKFSIVVPATSTSIKSLCNDQVYSNFHTTYDPNGEVRANHVGMRAICYAEKYAADGNVYTYGPTDGLTGIAIPDFCLGGIQGTAKVGTGNCNIQVCWEQATSILTISGNCYGLTSDVYGIYVYYPNDDTSYFMYISGYTFPQTCPFSFHYTGVTEWQLAKFISTVAYINFETSTNTNGEIEVTLVPSSASDTVFPTWKSVCYPRTDAGKLPETPLSCYYGVDSSQYSTDCTAADQLCGIYATAGGEYKNCISWTYCYTCDCGADVDKDLPTYGYACCDVSLCNIVSVSTLFCITGGSSLIPGGLLVTLFVALLTKWFN
jgi:hypothetical protein